MYKMKQKVAAAIKQYGFDAKAIAAATGLSVLTVEQAFAAVDYTALTAAADFSGLGTALVGVIIALIGASLLIAGGFAIWSITKKGKNVG